jgi:hypothetical protein
MPLQAVGCCCTEKENLRNRIVEQLGKLATLYDQELVWTLKGEPLPKIFNEDVEKACQVKSELISLLRRHIEKHQC